MIKEELKGYQWAKNVVEGKFIANKWVTLECQRYIDRMDNGLDSDLIEFDFKECEKVYGLLSIMNYATGFYANTPIIEHAHGFQMMIWENIFCWFYKELDELGFRKKVIEEVYLEIGRKASKSFICGVTEILIMLRADRFAQTACAGLTRDISSLVRNSVVEIIKSSPLIEKYFKITRDKVTCKINESTMRHLSGEANNINGLLLASYIVDEVANQTDSSIIDALKLSQMNTKTRLSIYISTQYDKPINAFNNLIDYHKNTLLGVNDDVINSFGLLFELDEGDDYSDENNWWKCNPLQMSMENGRQFLRQEFKKGLSIPSALQEFRIKILNERLDSNCEETFIDYEYIKQCKQKLPLDFWKNKDVYLSLDCSQSDDLTAVSMLTYYDNKIYCKSWAWIPCYDLNIKSKRDRVDYKTMIDKGYAFLCGDGIIDYSMLEDFIINISKKYGVNVVSLGYDRRDAMSSVKKLEENCIECIEIKQHSSVLFPPTKLLKESILNKEFVFDDNKLLEVQFTNTKCKYDENMHYYITKKHSNGKIDCVITIVLALYLLQQELLNGSTWVSQR